MSSISPASCPPDSRALADAGYLRMVCDGDDS